MESEMTINGHSNEVFCCGYLNHSVKKKLTALVVIICIQAPILYMLYASEIPQYWTTKSEFTKLPGRGKAITRSNSVETNKTFKGNLAHKPSDYHAVVQGTFSKNDTMKEYAVINKTVQEEKLHPVENMNAETEDRQNNIDIGSPNNVITSSNSNPETSEEKADIMSSSNGDNKEETGDKPGTSENTSSENVEAVNEPKTSGNKPFVISTSNKKVETVNEPKTSEEKPVLPHCPNDPPGLQGPLDISFANEPDDFKQTEENNPLVSSGGYFKPPFCIANSKVAIIIPFRNRDHHLKYFAQYMHPILQRQQLEYRLYIINQFGNGKFNRAKLMNIGYAESIKDLDFGCFVFHDVDLILENDRALYSCPEQPRHLSSAVDKFNYRLPYESIFGGVTEMTKKQFVKINGYSNSFWGWGGEDDDMYNRVRLGHMNIIRYPITTSRYRMITHQREKGNEDNPRRFQLIQQTSLYMKKDGLSSLHYKVISREDHPLYTNVTVEVFPPT